MLQPHKRNNVNEIDTKPLCVYIPLLVLTYHQVVWCISLHARWNRNTEFCNYPRIEIPDPVPTEKIVDINWCFTRIYLKVERSYNETSGSTFSKD